MDADAIALAKGAEVYKFDYDHADVADTFLFSARHWGHYSADSKIVMGDSITPSLDSNSKTVQAAIWLSVPLGQLTQYQSAHVEWDGAGFTVSYSLNGGQTWTLIDEHGAIALDPSTNPDLDFSVGFAAGQDSGAAYLTSLTVRILKNDTLTSTLQAHPATFTADVLTGSSIVLTNGMLDLAPDTSDAPQSYSTIEMWAQIGSAGRVVDNAAFSVDEASNALSFTGCTVYLDGQPINSGASIDSSLHHIVIVGSAATNTETRIAQALDGSQSMNLTLTHLALYPNSMTASDVLALYEAQSALPSFSIIDDGAAHVSDGWTQQNPDGTTTAMPAVDIYAYAWSFISSTT